MKILLSASVFVLMALLAAQCGDDPARPRASAPVPVPDAAQQLASKGGAAPVDLWEKTRAEHTGSVVAEEVADGIASRTKLELAGGQPGGEILQ